MLPRATRQGLWALAMSVGFFGNAAGGAAAPARAKGAARQPALAVLYVDQGGGAPALRRDVEQALGQALRRLGYRVIDHPAVRARLAAAALGGAGVSVSCRLGPCLQQVGRLLGTERGLLVHLAAHGSSYDIVLTLLETASGTTLAQSATRCDVCTFEDVAQHAARAVTGLARRAEAKLARQARLEVAHAKGVEELWIDDVPQGPPPLTLGLAPGRHRLSQRRRGGLVRHYSFRLAPGERLALALPTPHPGGQLAAAEVDEGQQPRPWPAWLALGTAATAALAGALVLAFDSDCPSHRCREDGGSRGIGMGLLAGGAAAGLASASFFAYHAARARASSARRRQARLSLTAGPGLVSLRGSF